MNSYLNISAEKLFYLLSIEVGDIWVKSFDWNVSETLTF